MPSVSEMELGGIPYLLVFGYLGVFDGVFWFFHRLCGIFFVTLQDIRAKAEPSLTEKVKKNENNEVKKNENNAIAFFKLRNLKT